MSYLVKISSNKQLLFLLKFEEDKIYVLFNNNIN